MMVSRMTQMRIARTKNPPGGMIMIDQLVHQLPRILKPHKLPVPSSSLTKAMAKST